MKTKTTTSEPGRTISPREYQNQVAWVASYMRYLADGMNLRDWKLALELDPGLRDSLATIECLPNRQMAVVRVGEGFFDADGHDQRHGLVHELVHLHLEGVRRVACSVEAALAPQAYGVYAQNHDDQIESSVDRLTCAISAGFLMPSQWKKKSRV